MSEELKLVNAGEVGRELEAPVSQDKVGNCSHVLRISSGEA
jgi:hypothetical protein